MSNVQEIPQMVSQLVDISKQYVRQETIEPAKRLGKAAGMGILASILFAAGGLLLSMAMLRTILGVIGDGPIASAMGYLIAMAVLVIVIGILGWRMKKYVE